VPARPAGDTGAVRYGARMVGFVLSGGASLGAIEAGMLRALYEHGIAPELIVGTSAGAVNGAYIASRPPTVPTAESLAELWRGMQTLEVFTPNPLTAVLGLVGERDHLVSNAGVKRVLEANTQFRRLEDASIPFPVIATDVLSGQKQRLSHGYAEAAVLASAAIPGVVAMKEVLTDLQHLEELYDQIGSRIEIYNTFRALLTGLMLGAADVYTDVRDGGLLSTELPRTSNAR